MILHARRSSWFGRARGARCCRWYHGQPACARWPDLPGGVATHRVGRCCAIRCAQFLAHCLFVEKVRFSGCPASRFVALFTNCWHDDPSISARKFAAWHWLISLARELLPDAGDSFSAPGSGIIIVTRPGQLCPSGNGYAADRFFLPVAAKDCCLPFQINGLQPAIIARSLVVVCHSSVGNTVSWLGAFEMPVRSCRKRGSLSFYHDRGTSWSLCL